MRKSIALLTLAFCLGWSNLAQAEIVTNGGFESGSFNGWTLTDPNGIIIDPSATANTGSYAATLGSVGSTASLSQVLTTVAGTTYTFTFALQNLATSASDGFQTNSFQVRFGNNVVLDGLTGPLASPGYNIESFTVTATSDTTFLSFIAQNDSAAWLLDDVSVSVAPVAAVPEPATWGMMLLGFAGIAVVTWRRRPAVRVALRA